jgi:transposase-like protein
MYSSPGRSGRRPVIHAPSNVQQGLDSQPTSIVSEDFLRNLRQIVRNEFRNEVTLRTTIVDDCLVCKQSPSADCPICKGKYQLSLRKFNENSVSERLEAKTKSAMITGFSEAYVKYPRLYTVESVDQPPSPPPSPPRISTRPSAHGSPPIVTRGRSRSPSKSQHSFAITHASISTPRNILTSSNAGELHETILALRRQILQKDTEIDNMHGTLEDSKSNAFYWKQQYQAANGKLASTESKLAATEDQVRELEARVEELLISNAQLLERTQVSEACRTNSARVIARMKKEAAAAGGQAVA